jgi:ethanolaminephosphotransferase
LDNADGKQARKTGNSSPLGLTIDHGADAINAVMLPMSLIPMIYLESKWFTPLILISITCGFYAATLEEYYCGRLDLPLFNGVSDGCVMVYAIGLISGLAGSSYWKTKLFYQLTMSEIFILAFFIASLITISSK